MNKYQSHKIVEAGQITSMGAADGEPAGDFDVGIEGDAEPYRITKDEGERILRAALEIGVSVEQGHLMVYKDGYVSWAPNHTMEDYDLVHPSSESEIEKEIQDKGLNAPRIKPIDLDDEILAEQYHQFAGTTVTVCCLTLQNGFNVVGESAAVSPENFDTEVGRKVAFNHARDKIWQFLGFRLKDQLTARGN